MSSASYGLVLVFLAGGCALGWYVNKAYASHNDIKVTKGRIRNYRKSRQRNGVIAMIMALIIGVIVFDLIRPHG